jgi:Fe-S cluster biogenesis protein NfuA/nitrite reductase/ring-hydroxylating ferredoxin subunit
MHGLIRADLRTRVGRVIEMVRPYMQSHGGDVTLVDVRDKTVLVRLAGNCNGCSLSSVTLRNTVEEALREHVPEIEKVDVVPNEPENLVQLQVGPSADDLQGWVAGPLISQLNAHKPFAFEDNGTKILVIQSRNGLRAFRNACAHQGLPLETGLLDADSGTITCPWHGFQYDAESGECFSAPQCQLEAFPLRVQDDRVYVRPV